MEFIELVAALAAAQFLFFGFQVAKARQASGLQAPTMVGDPLFERTYRVQMNTLEVLIAFYPALYLAAQHWPAVLVAPIGAVYLLGRHLYWRGYVKDASKRGLGFMLSMIPTMALVALALVGSVWAMFS